MEISATRQDITSVGEEVLAVPVFKSEPPRDGILGVLDSLTHGAIADVFTTGEFDGSDSQTVFLHRTGDLAARRLLLIGAGNRESMTPAKLSQVAGTVVRSVVGRGATGMLF